MFPCDSSPEVTEYQCISGRTSNKKKRAKYFSIVSIGCAYMKDFVNSTTSIRFFSIEANLLFQTPTSNSLEIPGECLVFQISKTNSFYLSINCSIKRCNPFEKHPCPYGRSLQSLNPRDHKDARARHTPWSVNTTQLYRINQVNC